MSDKAIIVPEMPESCSKCKFMYEFYGVKKCQLLNVLKNGGKAIICVGKLNIERKECCPLVSEKEHDKKIRDKAIEEFSQKAVEQFTKFDLEHGFPTVGDCEDILAEIADQMKEDAFNYWKESEIDIAQN